MKIKSLEELARERFADFAYRKTGHKLDWRKLSSGRKLIWLLEIADIYIDCLNNLRKDLSIGKLPLPGIGSYEKGFIAGQANEAHRLNERINLIEDRIKFEISKFIEQEADKDVN